MSLQDTPSGERIHIAFFGKRNAGKSSLVNAVTGQELSVVSEVRGTTTDPVQKSMELLPLGPVVIIDTPGFDDEGDLGALRVKKAREVLRRTDLAVLVTEGPFHGFDPCEEELLESFRRQEIPYLLVCSKCDRLDEAPQRGDMLPVSAHTGEGIRELKERMGRLLKGSEEKGILDGMIAPGDTVVLVTPIDSAAPKGRLILPQQQVLREVLDKGAVAVVATEKELPRALDALRQAPQLVITDSQAFGPVSRIVPQQVPLTSFSILMARYKGFLQTAVHGVQAIARLQPGDRVLIAEGCTHHRQCEDIGTVKLPAWLQKSCGGELSFTFSSGLGFPEDLSGFSLILHCGGCMLREKEIRFRMRSAREAGIPFTNYGTAIAWMKGILPRSLRPVPGAAAWLEEE